MKKIDIRWLLKGLWTNLLKDLKLICVIALILFVTLVVLFGSLYLATETMGAIDKAAVKVTGTEFFDTGHGYALLEKENGGKQ